MTDYQKMIIQRKLYHLQTLASLKIACIAAAFNNIKNADVASADYKSLVQTQLAALEAASGVPEGDVIYVEQACQALRRIIEFVDLSGEETDNNNQGIVYPSWPMV